MATRQRRRRLAKARRRLWIAAGREGITKKNSAIARIPWLVPYVVLVGFNRHTPGRINYL